MLSSSNRISLLFLNYFLQHVPSQTVDYVTVPRARRRLECESIKTSLTIYGKRVKVDFWEIFFFFCYPQRMVRRATSTDYFFFLSFFLFLSQTQSHEFRSCGCSVGGAYSPFSCLKA
jgi:hypothetical protein